jgi:hypothetical protein
LLPPTESILSHRSCSCGTFNRIDYGPVKWTRERVMAHWSSFGGLVDATECLEARNAAVERNVGAPTDLKESDDDPRGDDIDNIAALAGRDR